MSKKFRDLVAITMSPSAQRRAHELAQRDLAEMELAELREALKIRQEDLAARLKLTQATISRLERRPNILLASLSNYIQGLGGKLELRAVLPDRTVTLTNLLSATGEPKKHGNPIHARAYRARLAGNAIRARANRSAMKKKKRQLQQAVA